MRTAWADQLRTVTHTLSEDGKREITIRMILTTIGAEDARTQSRVRRAICHMVARGEMKRVRDGVFTYVPGVVSAVSQYGESFKHMWRVIRKADAGWTVNFIAGTVRLHTTTVAEYCRWLEQEGYITRCGKDGNSRLYRATQKAADELKTPYPPAAPKDLYAKERGASCRLVRLFMEANPGKHRVKIVTECRAILARFEEGENHVE